MTWPYSHQIVRNSSRSNSAAICMRHQSTMTSREQYSPNHRFTAATTSRSPDPSSGRTFDWTVGRSPSTSVAPSRLCAGVGDPSSCRGSADCRCPRSSSDTGNLSSRWSRSVCPWRHTWGPGTAEPSPSRRQDRCKHNRWHHNDVT